MLSRLIQVSVEKHLLVVGISAFLMIYGAVILVTMPVDVFPDFTRPMVTIMAEAPGLAPEEVETLVTIPLETNVLGGPNVARIRSASTVGLSIVFVEFDWGSDVYTNRQIVAERLQLAQSQLPERVTAHMGPVASIMGTIKLVAVTSETGQTSPLDRRTLTDWVIRPRLLAVPGVAQVTTMGGGLKQYQVLASPVRLVEHEIPLGDLERALREASRNTGGGFVDEGSREWLVRNLARAHTLDDLGETVVAHRNGTPILVRDVAAVQVAPRVKRGEGAFNARPAVIAAIYKQPDADTLAVTRAVERALVEVRSSLPADIRIESQLFQQADFITAAVENVGSALAYGALLVIIVVFLFLTNFRITGITVTAIPLSFVITALILKYYGFSVNTMTLGGLAVAVGALVDDAIVGVENVFRRLRENGRRANPRSALSVICEATCEVRMPLVYANAIIVMVVVPLFFLSGMEGRIFTPLGIAFVISIVASLIVSLTLTPALCAFLLPGARVIRRGEDSSVLRYLKARERRVLDVALDQSSKVIGGVILLVVVSLALVPWMGREFLPPFNEGSLTVNVLADPGISLEGSDRIGVMAEHLLLDIPEVVSTARRTGRAELDEHAEGVHYTEIDVVLRPSDRSRDAIMDDARQRLAAIPGIYVSVGQPISHQIDHMLAGVYAQIAIKVFGPDVRALRTKAVEIERAISGVRGVTDLRIEQQIPIPQLQIRVDRREAARYGLRPGQVSEALETALYGRVLGYILEGERSFELLLRYDDRASRESPDRIGDLRISAGSDRHIPIRALAEIRRGHAPNQILRENGLRRIVVQSNVTGRDVGSVVDDIQERIAETVRLPEGYFVEYGGQFEVQQQATRTILLLSILSVLAIAVLLQAQFGSWRATLMLMVILPLALIGAIAAIFVTGGTVSVASLVGFVTLFGIVARCGILLLSHYLHLVQHEGETFGRPMIIRGTLERVAPILMTALTTGIGLIPLVLSPDAPGREILFPLAVVVMGGLISSTVLILAVLPVLFYRFGRPIVEQSAPIEGEVVLT